MTESWRARLRRRLGWSFGAATLWTWGLLALRMPRDGFPPLEVWFSYSLSFLMTSVYVYMGLLIYSTLRAENRSLAARQSTAGVSGQGSPGAPSESGPLVAERPSGLALRLQRARRPLALLGLAGLAISIVSLAAWLALRYPGPQAIPGTQSSVVLTLMILGVAIVSTLIARE